MPIVTSSMRVVGGLAVFSVYMSIPIDLDDLACHIRLLLSGLGEADSFDESCVL